MPTRDELLRLAAEAEAESRKLADEARRLALQAQGLRELAETGALHPVQGTDKNEPMTDAHREAISRSLSRNSGPMKAARAAGFRTQADVAKALDVSESFFSQVLRGDKAMPPDRAAEFERLTKFPARRWKS